MKTLFIALVAFMLSTSAISQDKKEKDRQKEIARQLGVKEDKAKEIAAALDYNLLLIRQVVRDTSISQDERKKKIALLQDQRKQKIQSVATPQQLQKLNASAQAAILAHRQKNTDQMKQDIDGSKKGSTPGKNRTSN